MLEEVPYSAVAKHSRAAAKDHVSVSDTKRTTWYRTPRHEGFCALLEVGRDAVRIKGVYVHPEWRGRGIGSAMTDELLRKAASGPYKVIEVLAYNPAFYESRGFTRKNQLRNGAWRLVKQ